MNKKKVFISFDFDEDKALKDLLDRYDDYFDNREKFHWYERLGDPSARPEQLIDAILKIAQYHE